MILPRDFLGRGWPVVGSGPFLFDRSPRPRGASIDRIDNDGHYAPDNCQWATATEQRRKTRRIVITPEKLETIRAMRATGHSCARIGSAVGIGKSHVSQILRGRLWAVS